MDETSSLFGSLFSFHVIGLATVTLCGLLVLMYLLDWACRKKLGTFNLKGKAVVITGGGSGIGRQLALCFASRGCTIVLWDLQPDLLKETQRLCGPACCCITQIVDVSKEEAVKAAAQDLEKILKEKSGAPADVSVVVSCAGIVFGKNLLDLSGEEIRRTLNVNTLGPMWVTRAFLPGLTRKRTETVIVNVSSLMGSLSAAGLADYCASKWALNGFHECLRQELNVAGSNIRTLLVAPYIVNTGMFQGAMSKSTVYWFQRLLFPPLSAVTVGRSIVAAIEHRQQILVLPKVFALAPTILHLLPTTVYDWIVGQTGGQSGLKNFKGRPKKWKLPSQS